MAKRQKKEAEQVVIHDFKRSIVKVSIEAMSSLLMHRFPTKAMRQMEEKQEGVTVKAGRGRKGRESRDRFADFAACPHYFTPKDEAKVHGRIRKMNRGKGAEPGQDVTRAFAGVKVGFPATGFKEATMRAMKNTSMAMKDFNGVTYFSGTNGSRDLVEVRFKRVIFRRDFVRINNGMSTDLRYRPEFFGWSAEMYVEYVGSLLDANSMLNAINIGGFIGGIGDWRPNSKGAVGDHGRYKVAKR